MPKIWLMSAHIMHQPSSFKYKLASYTYQGVNLPVTGIFTGEDLNLGTLECPQGPNREALVLREYSLPRCHTDLYQ